MQRAMRLVLLLMGLGSPGLLLTACGFAPEPRIVLAPLGTYATGVYGRSAAEIPAYDPASRRLFIVNADAATVDVVDIADPAQPTLLHTIDVTPYGAVANSVAVHNGLVAVAVEASNKTDPGTVVLFDRDGRLLAQVRVGALPDMLTFTPDGRRIVVANEGEPESDYDTDPEGSISIIDLQPDPRAPGPAAVRTIGFAEFNAGASRHAELDPQIRIYGPGASVAQDLEPEYIAVAPDSRTAYVTLQENNALGIIDLEQGRVTRLVAFGTKDHSLPGMGLDASDQDGAINITSWPVRGMYQPDGIAAFSIGGQTFLATANEGDIREYEAFDEEHRLDEPIFRLDPGRFPNAAELKQDERLGRLYASTASGDVDRDGDFDELHVFGARSFAIWDAQGKLVYDSGEDFERIIANQFPDHFNASMERAVFDERSDDRGPEPEAIAVGVVRNKTLAFIGLETMGGVMVYDISNPRQPDFVQYINPRRFTADQDPTASGDAGPEGMLFIPAHQSPIRLPLLVVANEMSGSTTVYQLRP
ncbi:choice-of-anchor I family protein [Kallotenue papyrolyticum]|uniref:choice-of-anchor I family protein n=1 Tax=Kallotenue papyrolyticum TaxID=1325125 RepID=UPI0004BBA9EA|nr:YncE family protein [Kallotenue papyrolyticum]